MKLVEIPWYNFSSAVIPKPDSTEDSTGGLDATDLQIFPVFKN